MSTIYQFVDKMLKPLSECTFMSSGLQPRLQTVYFCHDCNPAMNETYCESCAEKCHFDHHLTKGKKLKSYCFCGKKLHQVVNSVVVSNTKECTFWELDEYSKALTNNNNAFNCKECKKKFCNYCVFFCHYHHIDKIVSYSTNDMKGCGCDNSCHKDDRVLFYYMKDFSMFRLDNLFNTHMINLLFEAPATSTKLFGFFNKKMKDMTNDLSIGKFKWEMSLISSSSGFLRALMCIFFAVRNVNIHYFSPMRNELIVPKTIIDVCINNNMEDKYEVRVIKKNLLFVLYKLQLIQDFELYNKYTAKDYPNISCIQRLTLYNSVRNDEYLRKKYFDQNFNFRMDTIKLLEKYANLCRVDDHISMSLFATILSIIKLLMQYGVYNGIQIRMIADILEILLKSLKLEKTSKANEEYKELIFKKLPSLLYIMIFAYNDYIVLENLLYSFVNLREFSIGKSNFGTKIMSSIFLSNIRYLLKYLESKKFNKIIKMTYKALAMLTSENDYFLKTLFHVEKSELIDFVSYYDILTDVNVNNNFPFCLGVDELYSGDIFFRKKFPNLPMRNDLIAQQLENIWADKSEIEDCYQDYFNLKKKNILDVITKINLKLRSFRKLTGDCSEDFDHGRNKGAMIEMISLLQQFNSPEEYQDKNKNLDLKWTVSDGQYLLNRSGFHFTIIKILKIAHSQALIITEDFFEGIIKFFEFYSKDSIPNTTNLLSACFLKYFFLYLNKFPHLILKMVYRALKFLKIREYKLSDYSYIYDTLKDSFNSKYTKLEDAERYITGFIYHMKCLKLIKNLLPRDLVTDMRIRIREFLERLNKNDNGIKEYFWVNNYKRRLLMKESEYINLINFEEYLNEIDKDKNLPKEERIKKFQSSSEAKKKKMIREIKRKTREENQLKKRRFDQVGLDYTKANNSNYGNDTLNITVDSRVNNHENENEIMEIEKINDDMMLEEPSFINDLTIEGDDIVRGKKQKLENNGNKNIQGAANSNLDYSGEHLFQEQEQIPDKIDEVPADNSFMLENVKNVSNAKHNSNVNLIDPNLPVIDENNFDNSMIKFEDNFHQEVSINNETDINKTDGKNILTPLQKDDSDFFSEIGNIGVNEIFNMNNENNPNRQRQRERDLLNIHANEPNADDDNFINNIYITEQEIQEENEILADVNNISPELFQNKKLRERTITKNKRELIKIKKIKAEERKQELLDRLMSSNKTAKAFVNLLEIINLYAEDFTSEEFQEIIRRYFPRTDINNILEQKRYVKDIKLRSQIIKMLRINYLNTPISKDKSYFDLFYLNEYDFFIKLYEKSWSNNNKLNKNSSKLSDTAKIAQILIFELSNLIDIIQPFFDSKQYDKLLIDKNKKAIRFYLSEGILSTVKQFSDKIYSHGNNLTGEELCLGFKVIFHFMEMKHIIDNLLTGKHIDDAVSVARQKQQEEDNELDVLFDNQRGGMDNFSRKPLFKILYKNLNSSLEIAVPEFRKKVDDVWFSLNKRVNNVEVYDGIDYLPDILDRINPLSLGKSKDIFIINEYSKICRTYVQQSKNYKSSPLLSCFNCILHEADFNYRDMFMKFFVLTFTNARLQNFEANYMIEIMNKSLEWDHEKLHPIIHKHLISEEKSQEKLFNELNKLMIYNMIILFVYVNRHDAFYIWEEANYASCQIVRFFKLLAKNPTTNLHDYILKHSHDSKDLNYNFFILLEALMNKIIKLSKWGREYDLKNEIFFDNMFVVFHMIISCLSDYAREADRNGVYLLYLRIKPLVYGLKKIMYYETSNVQDIIFELKLSILYLLNSLLDEAKAHDIISEISFYFDPFRMFKLCISLFKLLIKNLLKIEGVSGILTVQNEEEYEKIQLNIANIPQLLAVYLKEDSFHSSILLTICNKIFFYISTLKNVYKDSNAFKCFYAIKRFKNTMKGPKINNRFNERTVVDYKYLSQTGTLVDTFLEMDEITETEYVIYKFLKQSAGVIEIYSYRNKLEHVYFPRVPLSYYAHVDSVRSFMFNFYERDMACHKMESLNIFMHQMLEETFYSYHLGKYSNFLGVLDRASNFNYFKVVVIFINTAICLLNWAAIDTQGIIFKKLCVAFDSINLIVLTVLIVLWFLLRFYPRFKHAQYAYRMHNKLPLNHPLSFRNMMKVLIWDILICDFDFLYLITTCICCLFSVIYQIISLKFFQLTNFILLSKGLFRLISFIGHHCFEIFMLFIMCCILLGASVAMTVDFFKIFQMSKEIVGEGSDKNFCSDSFSMCVFYFIFYGLRYDAGISQAMTNNFNDVFYTQTPSNLIKRIILDVGFHIVIKGIWFTLFLSVFIFAYFELKNTQNLQMNDINNVCYICHMNRDIFMKYKINFDKHVKKEHSVYNYLYFIMYIVTKNEENLSKVEKYVLDKFRIADFSWIPINDTLELQEVLAKIKDGKTLISTNTN